MNQTISEIDRRLDQLANRGEGRTVSQVLAPLDELARSSSNLVVQRGVCFEVEGESCEIPAYHFTGPKGGDDRIRVGLFAGIHGDEPEGVRAIIQFLSVLEQKPELATGYSLVAYPICNPTGFQDNTRNSRSGKDLNREFWQQSTAPEVRFLEAELSARSFQGIISLHTDDTSDGFYGFAHGATLTENLVEPALQAAERVLSRNRREAIDGFKARNGIIRDSYPGVLCAPPTVRPRPFEIILETPQLPPEYLKAAAFVMALQTILAEYRNLLAFAQNL